MKQVFVAAFLVALSWGATARTYTDTFVVGGQDATINQFPYQVSIQENGKHLCSATIIKEDYVLTAAHCICDINGCRTLADLKIIAGVVDLGSSDQVVKSIDRVYLHKDFHAMLYTDDIAVVRVTDPFDLSNPGQKQIDLTFSSVAEQPTENQNQTNCVVAGWGSRDAATYVLNPNLSTITPSISNLQTCKNIYHNSLNNKEICAQAEGTCFIDPGAGLVCDGLLAGVMCVAYDCDEPNPVVFTELAKYTQWIQHQITRMDCTNTPILHDAACIDA